MSRPQVARYTAAYFAALAAERAWGTELRRLFGKSAGDARYTARGKSTPALRQLHAAWRDAMTELDAAGRAAFGAPIVAVPAATCLVGYRASMR